MAEVVISAPGKVLLTGGYLVLERPNPGIVLSTTARFYAIVKPLYEAVNPNSWAWIYSPRIRIQCALLACLMIQGTHYSLFTKKITGVCWHSQLISEKPAQGEQIACGNCRQVSMWTVLVEVETSQSSEVKLDPGNPFIEQALQYSVAAACSICSDKGMKDRLHKLLLQGLDITAIGCNDFYSYRNQLEAKGIPLTAEVLASIPPFSPITFNIENSVGAIATERKPEVAKTGLGSSAAMTTAVVAAVLQYLGVVNISSMAGNLHETMCNPDLDLVHVVAQTAHCIAQGKVGSGFDVSAAVYGSQRYIRFSPSVLSSAQVAVRGQPLEEVIDHILKEKWDHEKVQFSLPPLMTLLLGEPGTGGSSTPSMVGAVKQWQNSEPQKSAETWTRLAEANSKLEMQLSALKKFAQENMETYKIVIGNCGYHKHEKWLEQATDPHQEVVTRSLLAVRDAMLEIRFHLRQMGQAAGAPIEPESQTLLLDATMNLEGVLFAGVPGAGGFDAVVAVALGDSRNNIANVWSSQGVLPMLVGEDPRGLCLESGDPRTKEISSVFSAVHFSGAWERGKKKSVRDLFGGVRARDLGGSSSWEL
ncbi:hypothetical protein ACLOJK_022956 [Asimina triloba]